MIHAEFSTLDNCANSGGGHVIFGFYHDLSSLEYSNFIKELHIIIFETQVHGEKLKALNQGYKAPQ